VHREEALKASFCLDKAALHADLVPFFLHVLGRWRRERSNWWKLKPFHAVSTDGEGAAARLRGAFLSSSIIRTAVVVVSLVCRPTVLLYRACVAEKSQLADGAVFSHAFSPMSPSFLGLCRSLQTANCLLMMMMVASEKKQKTITTNASRGQTNKQQSAPIQMAGARWSAA